MIFIKTRHTAFNKIDKINNRSNLTCLYKEHTNLLFLLCGSTDIKLFFIFVMLFQAFIMNLLCLFGHVSNILIFIK